MPTTTYTDAFVEKLRTPDGFDFASGATSGTDTFFKQLGEIAKKVQTNALTVSDASSVKATLGWFSNMVNRMNGQLASISASAGADSEFARAFKSLASETNLNFQ